MSLTAGTRLGPYEVVAAIGAGGMGEVYRARDTKLNRDVALKILPPTFATDPDRLARFHREAQVLASLNHPHIAAIYGFEDSGDTHALVLELVEGPTLADRIVTGPIPVDEALAIAAQVAEALEAAHEQGIIHRDLKPANIKVKSDGSVKVLDFGLAKLAEPAGVGQLAAGSALSMSPTITSPAMMTRVGVLLGTAAYMAPEQARGKAADKRADIWAFGCVLYEMLTGQRAFHADGVSETIAAILRDDPDWHALPADTPPIIERLLRRCLRKPHKERVPDVAIARFEIDEALTSPISTSSGGAATSRPAARTRARLAWTVAGLALVIAAASAALLYVRIPAAAPETRLDVTTAATTDPISFAISPDGRRLVFVASPDGKSSLWLRPLDSGTAQLLSGTDGAELPFWSPDGRSIGFFADNKLKRIDVSGGLPQTLTDAALSRGGSWSRDGVILFSRTATGQLFRIPASGGEPSAVTRMPMLSIHELPVFLPDGRRFVFCALGPPDKAGIYLSSLDSETTIRLTTAASPALYMPSGSLLFLRQGTLVAQRLDLARPALIGDPITVADPVAFVATATFYAGAFSVSATGVIAYRAGAVARRQLVWFDRTGKALDALGSADDSYLSNPKLSPDDRRVAVSRIQQGNSDIWLEDGARSIRFTFDPGPDSFPLWTADGRDVLFDSNRKGHRDLYRKPANGGGMEELLFESDQDKAINDWSPDGRFILFLSRDPQTARDLWVLPMTGDRKPFAFLRTKFDEWRGRFSPDEHWVLYQSNESGRFEIYVRPFPGPGGQWQISTAGGISPNWSRSGKEVYYVAPDAKLMAVPITATGTTLEPGTPVALFQTRIVGGGSEVGQGYQYDVARDGRFLINVMADEASASPITVVLNWAGLKQ